MRENGMPHVNFLGCIMANIQFYHEVKIALRVSSYGEKRTLAVCLGLKGACSTTVGMKGFSC